MFDFNTASKSEQEEVLKEIDSCLQTAYKYDAYVDTQYLRCVVVPRYFDPNCHVWFETLYVTFPSVSQRADYIKEMLESGKCKLSPKFKTDLQLIKFGTIIATLECVLENNGGHYEHNYLIYGKDGFRTTNPDFTVDYMLEQFKEKKVKLLRKRWNQLYISDGDLSDIDKSFFKRGWIICTPFKDSFIEHKSVESIKEQMEKERKSKEIAVTIDSIANALGKLKTLIN